MPPVTETVIPQTEPQTLPPQTETTVETADELETAPVLALNPEDYHAPQTEPTEPKPTQEQKNLPEISGVVWVVIAAAVITAILVVVLLIRMILHSGGRYSE